MGMLTGVDKSLARRSIIAGVVVALVVAVAGAGYALTRTRTWTAESSVVVLPAAGLEDAVSASYYELLSRGQIVATFAEVAGTLRLEQQAEDKLGLSPEQRAQVSTVVTVVPNTSVILIRATSDDPKVAESMADAVTAAAASYLAGIVKPFRTEIVQPAGGTATSTSLSPLVLLAATLVVAVIAGLAVQQAVYHLSVAVRRSRRREVEPADNDAPTPAPAPAGRRDPTGVVG
jgi:capsular polysaccharide biosynthesis protein